MKNAHITEGEFVCELGETGAGSYPGAKENRALTEAKAGSAENLSQAGCALPEPDQIPAPDRAGYEFAWTAFLRAKRDFPRLNHKGTEPQAATFGLEEIEAAVIRNAVRKEIERRA